MARKWWDESSDTQVTKWKFWHAAECTINTSLVRVTLGSSRVVFLVVLFVCWGLVWVCVRVFVCCCCRCFCCWCCFLVLSCCLCFFSLLFVIICAVLLCCVLLCVALLCSFLCCCVLYFARVLSVMLRKRKIKNKKVWNTGSGIQVLQHKFKAETHKQK